MKEKVLIIYSSALFANGLASILRRQRGLKIESSRSQKENGWGLIESLRPDVVLMEGSDQMIEASSVLCELLKINNKGRVISVNLDHKDAAVYFGLKIEATESNLIKAVKCQVRGFFKDSSGGNKN